MKEIEEDTRGKDGLHSCTESVSLRCPYCQCSIYTISVILIKMPKIVLMEFFKKCKFVWDHKRS